MSKPPIPFADLVQKVLAQQIAKRNRRKARPKKILSKDEIQRRKDIQRLNALYRRRQKRDLLQRERDDHALAEAIRIEMMKPIRNALRTVRTTESFVDERGMKIYHTVEKTRLCVLCIPQDKWNKHKKIIGKLSLEKSLCAKHKPLSEKSE